MTIQLSHFCMFLNNPLNVFCENDWFRAWYIVAILPTSHRANHIKTGTTLQVAENTIWCICQEWSFKSHKGQWHALKRCQPINWTMMTQFMDWCMRHAVTLLAIWNTAVIFKQEWCFFLKLCPGMHTICTRFPFDDKPLTESMMV